MAIILLNWFFQVFDWRLQEQQGLGCDRKQQNQGTEETGKDCDQSLHSDGWITNNYIYQLLCFPGIFWIFELVSAWLNITYGDKYCYTQLFLDSPNMFTVINIHFLTTILDCISSGILDLHVHSGEEDDICQTQREGFILHFWSIRDQVNWGFNCKSLRDEVVMMTLSLHF